MEKWHSLQGKLYFWYEVNLLLFRQGYGKLTTAEGVVTLGQWYQNELTGQQIL